MEPTSRRQFLKNAGGTAIGVIAVSGLAGGILSCTNESSAAKPSLTPTSNPTPTPASPTSLATVPWHYKSLDPVAVAERAYAAYSNGGCMFGAFEGIVGELRDKFGAPYDAFPTTMMKYGGAGVSGWGTLCGALNGAAAAISLLTPTTAVNPIINEVFGWYGVTALPDYKPIKPKFTISTSVANSQLCHVSVTIWCVKTGLKALSPERAERCAWLTASVAQYTIDLLNKQAAGTFKANFALPASVTGCLSCHGKGGALENVHASNQTTCTNCHDTLPSKHPPVTK